MEDKTNTIALEDLLKAGINDGVKILEAVLRDFNVEDQPAIIDEWINGMYEAYELDDKPVSDDFSKVVKKLEKEVKKEKKTKKATRKVVKLAKKPAKKKAK